MASSSVKRFGAAADDGVAGGVSSSEFDDFLASRLGVGADSVAAGADSASGAASSPALIRSIGDVPSISATSGAVPRDNRTPKKNEDQDLLLG